MLLRYLTLEIKRTFRDRRFVFFTMAFPVAMYLLWANVSTGSEAATGLSVGTYLMVSMASYGAIGAAVTTTGARLAAELGSGWLRQLQVTPLPGWAVISAKTVASMALALPPIALVGLTAALTQHVHLSAAQWAGLAAVLWIGTLPFAALGTLIGSAVKGDAAHPASVAVYLGLSMIGGLWIPAAQLPSALRSISRWTPSNRFAELGWGIVGGHAPSGTAALILAGWTVLLGGLATVAYRRATVTAS
jgi:ABC-2 type transport system permease protein